MKVLFLAPQPFYQERGTPIAVRHLVTELARRGWSIDLLVFHEGEDFVCPNVRVFRIPRPPGVRRVQPGLSLKKVACDVVFFFTALRMLRRTRYDLIHAVEEAVFMAALMRPLARVPYVYDMDSSLPEQVAMKSRFLRLFSPVSRWMESAAMRHACIVLPVCESLAEVARLRGAYEIMVLRDPPLNTPGRSAGIDGPPIASAASPGAVRFMYIGNLAFYQGIDLLLDAFARFARHVAFASLVIVGGSEMEIEEYQHRCRRLHISDRVELLGAQPVARLDELMNSADVLVSPRTQGANTPMKVYSYLQSGRAILATDVAAHKPVLTPEVALLVPPEPEKVAEGMERLATDRELRTHLGTEAVKLARARYSPEAFGLAVNAFCRRVEFLLGDPDAPARGEPETADVESSTDAYAARFGGPVGAWMLGIQEAAVVGWVGERPAASVLDVGGGHGQVAIPLARSGHAVTVLGSAPSCAHRIREAIDAGRISFDVGDLVNLPYPDRAFDVAVSLRLLPHCRQWRRLIAELCRTARHGVIVDYPASRSVNALSSLLFSAKKRLEGNTRPFALFRHAQIEAEFARHGFVRGARQPQFLLPMVLHRTLNRVHASASLERAGRGLGLTRWFGSPVLVKMVRRDA